MLRSLCWLVSWASLLLLASQARASVIYVNLAATGANDGTTWTDAFTSLRQAISAASAGDEVWVARGTYSPGGAVPNRSDSFSVNGIGLYGGFAGDESTRAGRSLAQNPTVLTGELGSGLRAYHVLSVHTNAPSFQLAIVDGFSVVRGQADGVGPDGFGGGAIVYGNGPTGVVISNCRFLSNSATEAGAMYLGHSGVDVVNCVVAFNQAVTGAGIYGSFDVVMNCTFYGNVSTSLGNAIYCPAGNGGFWIAHCIAWGTGPTPIYTTASQPLDVYRSCVEGGYPGSLAIDPLFVNAASRDFRLSTGSPCIDWGDTAAFANLSYVVPTTDVAGRPRVLDDPSTVDGVQRFSPQVDIGAYEFLPDCDGDGLLDLDDIAAGTGSDLNQDTVLDRCQPAGPSFCFGDGSGAACPCGNSSPSGSSAGCVNATGGAGRLEAFGRAKLGHDTVVLHVSGLGYYAPGLYFQGDGLDLVAGTNGLPFGDGLRCAFGTIVRLGIRTSSAGSSSTGVGIDGDTSISVRGQVPPFGGTRYYQVWYRSALDFCTPATFNASNAVEVVWVP